MALCHFPSFFTPPHKFNTPQHLKWGTHHSPLHKNPTFACSADKSRKKGKVSKPTKSNEDLCNELREFISAAGLPEGRVPLMKELLENGRVLHLRSSLLKETEALLILRKISSCYPIFNGTLRKDLANIVRRRGYKVIAELLRNSFNNDSDTEKPSIEDQNFSNFCSDEASVQGRILIESAESVSSPSDSSMMEKHMVRTNAALTTDISVQIRESSESSVLSLHSRAANFVQTGKLDIFEEAFEIGGGEMPADSDNGSENISFNNTDDSAHADSQEVSLIAQQTDRDQVISNQGLEGADNDDDFTSETAGDRINQDEIDRLKALLHKKEMELLKLKQQIEKDKQSLCIMQDKSNEEISNAHRMVTEKDIELRGAEESLSGLKEVLIEYWGNGETVEVAGSFNGWHNRIKMDPHPSSEPVDSPCSRSLKLWSTILWLYPGIHEIKFIVDGTWKIDPNREITTSCNITNNVLRVDR